MCSECTKQAMAIQFPSGNHKNGLLWHTYHIDNVPPPIYLMILTRVGYKFDLNNSWARNCGTPTIEESMVYQKMCKYLHYYNITSLVYLYHLSRWLSTKGAGSHRTLVPTNITLSSDWTDIYSKGCGTESMVEGWIFNPYLVHHDSSGSE